jgi:hypothetical protein
MQPCIFIHAHYQACSRVQVAEDEQTPALQEVNKLQQQAALHLQGLQSLIDKSCAVGACITGNDSDTAQQFSGLDVQREIKILLEHLYSSLLLPAADAALRCATAQACLGIVIV